MRPLNIFIIAICLIKATFSENNLVPQFIEHEIVVGQSTLIMFEIRNQSEIILNETLLYFNASPFLRYPNVSKLQNNKASLLIQGENLVSGAIVEVVNCTTLGEETCILNLENAFARISVIRSQLISIFVQIVGWAYFFAWSISFYPQMYLNFKRKSVIGLNFDFLALNFFGFGAYAIFNLLMYYNQHVQEIYRLQNPRSPPPVLTNDVVFAVHAFFACSATILQCIFFERENQRVSKKCIYLIIAFVTFGLLSATLTVLNKISILQFVTSLSYIKMAVTCCKYFPQAYFNYVRKSTVGWSIGNILLDLTGGTLDIVQMIFQAVNVNDWSAFYANPVKFGLGFVSIIFDVFFILQHYVFYRNAQVAHNEYSGIDNPENETGDVESIGPIIVEN